MDMARTTKAGVAARVALYMPDDLFERILVQAHRRDETISKYLMAILEAAVPGHLAAGPTVWEFDTPLGRATLELDRGAGRAAALALARDLVAELEGATAAAAGAA
jgi:hypothetical protein